MASFAGQSLFGAAVQMETSDNPRATQHNAFPGLSGMEGLDMGLRGRYTSVQGILYGSNTTLLQSAEQFFRSYNDGNYYTLVDSFGGSWSNVRLESFEPVGKKFFHSQLGYATRYTARFHHLT